MERHNHSHEAYRPDLESELGALIRGSLEDGLASAEPSPQAWRNIVSRVQDRSHGRTLRQGLKRLAAWPVASLVQAIVVSTLLLAFGLGVEQSVVSRSRPGTETKTVTGREAALFEVRDDMLRGYVVLQMEKQPRAPRHVGGHIE
jgi:hypothetical protein